MMECNPQKTPCVSNVFDEMRHHIHDIPMANPTKFRELVGSLLYLQQVSRPDISFVTNILGRQMAKPTQYHWELGKKVLKYLKGTMNFSLNYSKVSHMELIGMVDADYANDIDRNSMTGFTFAFATNNSPISWRSAKQKLTATSTCNAEFVALSEVVCECIWLQPLFNNLRNK